MDMAGGMSEIGCGCKEEASDEHVQLIWRTFFEMNEKHIDVETSELADMNHRLESDETLEFNGILRVEDMECDSEHQDMMHDCNEDQEHSLKLQPSQDLQDACVQDKINVKNPGVLGLADCMSDSTILASSSSNTCPDKLSLEDGDMKDATSIVYAHSEADNIFACDHTQAVCCVSQSVIVQTSLDQLSLLPAENYDAERSHNMIGSHPNNQSLCHPKTCSSNCNTFETSCILPSMASGPSFLNGGMGCVLAVAEIHAWPKSDISTEMSCYTNSKDCVLHADIMNNALSDSCIGCQSKVDHCVKNTILKSVSSTSGYVEPLTVCPHSSQTSLPVSGSIHIGVCADEVDGLSNVSTSLHGEESTGNILRHIKCTDMFVSPINGSAASCGLTANGNCRRSPLQELQVTFAGRSACCSNFEESPEREHDSDMDTLPTPDTAPSSERRGSKGSLERFLAPSLAITRVVTTPMDDPGFSKVPGLNCGLSVTVEEEPVEDTPQDPVSSGLKLVNQDVSDCLVSSEFDTSDKFQTADVQPPSPVIMRKEKTIASETIGSRGKLSRPSSLLGLSKPLVDVCAADKLSPKPMSVNGTTGAELMDTAPVASDREIPKATGLPLPRQRPIFSMTSTGHGRPNSLTLLQRPTSWSPAAASTPSSSGTSKRPCSLNLSVGISKDSNVSNIGPSETKCRRTLAIQPFDTPMQSCVDSQPEIQPVNDLILPLNASSSSSLVVSQSSQIVDVLNSRASDVPTLSLNVPATTPPACVENHMPILSSATLSSTSQAGPSSSPVLVSPPLSANIDVNILELGMVAPVWLPDASAPRCMHCNARFTFTRRRHHCRACGKVFCSTCCNIKSKLKYLGNKDARVCSKCHIDLLRALWYQRSGIVTSTAITSVEASPSLPSFSNGSGCTCPPQTTQAVTESTSVNGMHSVVLTTEAIERPGQTAEGRQPLIAAAPACASQPHVDDRDSESRHFLSSSLCCQVDIVPSHSASTPDDPDPLMLQLQNTEQRSQTASRRLLSNVTERSMQRLGSCALTGSDAHHAEIEFLPSAHSEVEQMLDARTCSHYPCAASSDLDVVDGEDFVDGPNVDVQLTFDSQNLQTSNAQRQVQLNDNLLVSVSLVNLDCCVHSTCWCITTQGLRTVGQNEIVMVLESLPDEADIPQDLFAHICTLYSQAMQGNILSDLDYSFSEDGILGNKENAGFLFVQPTYQCLKGLTLPECPFLLGILILRAEVAWATVLPLRLMLRLASEFCYYPCPLMSVRNRRPVFTDIGNSVLELLVDKQNGICRLPSVPGLHVYLENYKTVIELPRTSLSQVITAVNSCKNEHSLVLAAQFSMTSDSHLTCMQSRDGRFQTQAVKIHDRPRKVTGVSFIICNMTRKKTSWHAKSSIVEDGILLQLSSDLFAALRKSLCCGENFSVVCEDVLDVTMPYAEESVVIQWTDDTSNLNVYPR